MNASIAPGAINNLAGLDEPPDRRTYLGGTDIAAILGSHPYKSALNVYARKIGAEPDEAPGLAAELGLRLESSVAQMYADQEGVQLRKGAWVRGPVDHTGGTPDFELDGRRYGLEIKTAGILSPWSVSDEWGENESDQVPEHYALQCHWYMAITGHLRWDLAALIGGRGYAVFRLKRDNEVCAGLLDIAAKFWRDHVAKQVPPSPDGSEAAREALQKLWPRERRPLLRATPNIEGIAHNYRMACEGLQQAEELKLLMENSIKAVIADAEGIEGAGWRITWKAPKPSLKVDMEALEADPAAALLLAKYRREVQGARRIHKNWNTTPKEK